jgi:L-serine/L-threonine ammonia-lyase
MKASFFARSWKYILSLFGFCLFCFPVTICAQIYHEGDFMKPLHINTPLLESSVISKKTGRQIFLKMEALQPTGSFKIRGIGHLCSELARNGVCRFVTSSAGNGGLAVAYAGRKLNIPVTVVVWNAVSEITCEKLRREGAEIVVHGNDWMEANTLAQSMCEEKGVSFVHPFDHPLIWEGHASLVHEVKATGIKPDVVVVAVGGGGLLCGVIQGLHEVGWSDVAVFTAETSGAASLAESIKAEKLITLDKIDTIALSLGARRVAEQAFEWTHKHPIIPLVVSDAQTVNAVFQFADDQRILVEPACGAALTTVYDKHPELMKYEKILVVVCGGCNVDLDLLEEWKENFRKSIEN